MRPFTNQTTAQRNEYDFQSLAETTYLDEGCTIGVLSLRTSSKLRKLCRFIGSTYLGLGESLAVFECHETRKVLLVLLHEVKELNHEVMAMLNAYSVTPCVAVGQGTHLSSSLSPCLEGLRGRLDGLSRLRRRHLRYRAKLLVRCMV